MEGDWTFKRFNILDVSLPGFKYPHSTLVDQIGRHHEALVSNDSARDQKFSSLYYKLPGVLPVPVNAPLGVSDKKNNQKCSDFPIMIGTSSPPLPSRLNWVTIRRDSPYYCTQGDWLSNRIGLPNTHLGCFLCRLDNIQPFSPV